MATTHRFLHEAIGDWPRRAAMGLATAAVLVGAVSARAGPFAQGPKLVGTGAIGTAYQGSRIALSYDGNTALVGGYGDNSNAGAAWVFTRSAGVWTQQGAKLVATGATGNANQGGSV